MWGALIGAGVKLLTKKLLKKKAKKAAATGVPTTGLAGIGSQVMFPSVLPGMGSSANVSLDFPRHADGSPMRLIGTRGPNFGNVLSGSSSTGFPRRRRRKGITATELAGARKVAKLVGMYGLKPKTGARVGRKRC